jgi:hypothetical protein
MAFPIRQPGGFGVGSKAGSQTWANPIDLDHSQALSEGQAWATALGNWGKATSAASLGGTFAPQFAWDDTYGRWCGFVNALGNSLMVDTLDGGRTWNALNVLGAFTSLTVVGAVASEAGGILAVATSSMPATNCYAEPTSGTIVFFSTSVNLSACTAFWLASASNYVVVGALQSGATFTGGASFATGLANATAQTLPSGWASGTNHVGQYLSATNGTIGVVVMCGATPGTDTAKLLQVAWTGSALAFTDITPAIFTGAIVTGFTYDAADKLWGVLTYSGGVSRMYVSFDLVTWTIVQTFSPSGLYQGLVAVGNVTSTWAVVAPFDASAIHASSGILISDDVVTYAAPASITPNASSTWHFGTASFQSVGNVGLAGNGNQIAAFSPTMAAISEQVGLVA